MDAAVSLASMDRYNEAEHVFTHVLASHGITDDMRTHTLEMYVSMLYRHASGEYQAGRYMRCTFRIIVLIDIYYILFLPNRLMEAQEIMEHAVAIAPLHYRARLLRDLAEIQVFLLFDASLTHFSLEWPSKYLLLL